VYTVLGRVDQRRRKNLEAMFSAAHPYISEALGGDAAVDKFAADWFSQWDSPDRSFVLPLWFVTATV
jgi:hypothetical protein